VKRFMAIAAVVIATGGWQAGPARADTSSVTTDAPKAAELTRDVNALRAGQGLPALAIDAELTAKATGWARTMAEAGRIWHSTLPDGITADWAALGENVGTGGSVEGLHQAFVNSPHHYENLVRPDFEYIGVGIAEVDGALYASEVFMKLQPSPAPAPVPAPSPASANGAGSGAPTPAKAPAGPVVAPPPRPSAPPAAERAVAPRAVTPATPGATSPAGPAVTPSTTVGPAAGPATAPAGGETAAPALRFTSYRAGRPIDASSHRVLGGLAVAAWAAVAAALAVVRRRRPWPPRRRKVTNREIRRLVAVPVVK